MNRPQLDKKQTEYELATQIRNLRIQIKSLKEAPGTRQEEIPLPQRKPRIVDNKQVTPPISQNYKKTHQWWNPLSGSQYNLSAIRVKIRNLTLTLIIMLIIYRKVKILSRCHDNSTRVTSK